MAAIDGPIHSSTYSSLAEIPELRPAIVYGSSPLEPRTHRDPDWLASLAVVRSVQFESAEPYRARFDGGTTLPLRDSAALEMWIREDVGSELVLDITGLPLHVWAPILRAALMAQSEVDVLYAEPEEYLFSHRHDPMFDLSDSGKGQIRALPGLYKSAGPASAHQWLIALLGFEGPRFSAILEETSAPNHQIFPVVPVPGFRPEYPTYTFQANMIPLRTSRAWERGRFADASCPFALLYELESIADSIPPEDRITIAPLGTRPHTLGALLFHWGREARVEIMYDNPVQTPERTDGISRVHIYRVSEALRASGRL
jgi:hypothetical protein